MAVHWMARGVGLSGFRRLSVAGDRVIRFGSGWIWWWSRVVKGCGWMV